MCSTLSHACTQKEKAARCLRRDVHSTHIYGRTINIATKQSLFNYKLSKIYLYIFQGSNFPPWRITLTPALFKGGRFWARHWLHASCPPRRLYHRSSYSIWAAAEGSFNPRRWVYVEVKSVRVWWRVGDWLAAQTGRRAERERRRMKTSAERPNWSGPPMMGWNPLRHMHYLGSTLGARVCVCVLHPVCIAPPLAKACSHTYKHTHTQSIQVEMQTPLPV